MGPLPTEPITHLDLGCKGFQGSGSSPAKMAKKGIYDKDLVVPYGDQRGHWEPFGGRPGGVSAGPHGTPGPDKRGLGNGGKKGVCQSRKGDPELTRFGPAATPKADPAYHNPHQSHRSLLRERQGRQI